MALLVRQLLADTLCLCTAFAGRWSLLTSSRPLLVHKSWPGLAVYAEAARVLARPVAAPTLPPCASCPGLPGPAPLLASGLMGLSDLFHKLLVCDNQII